jgi:prepilin-type processing-associated H-X9-DG protein
MSGTKTDWPRGEWVLSFTNNFAKKPALLLCPKATGRRGPDDHESPVSADSPDAVEWGGPTTVYDFPIPDPADPARRLTASYGLNCWAFNPDTNNIQGRIAEMHWKKYGVPAAPSMTPLFLDSAWRGGGPSENDIPPSFNGQQFDFSAEMDVFAMARHGKGVNILFFDASVRYSSAKDLWSLPWHKGYDINAVNVTFPGWMN